eukprot:Gb_26323 [translate_table: standard]
MRCVGNNDPRVNLNRSAAFLNLVKLSKALTDAETTIKLNPAWEKGYFRKGCVLEAMERYDEAVASFREALQQNPQSTEVATKIKRLSLLARDKKRAQEKQAIRSNVNMAKTLEHLKSELVRKFLHCCLFRTETDVGSYSSWVIVKHTATETQIDGDSIILVNENNSGFYILVKPFMRYCFHNSRDLSGFICISLLAQVKPANVDAIIKWEQRDGRALATILLILKDSDYYIKFFQLKMAEGKSIASYKQFQVSAESTGCSRVICSEHDNIMTLMASLPESYENLVVSLGTQDWSYTPNRKKNTHKKKVTSKTANSSGYSTKKKGKCFYYKNLGHFAYECHKKATDSKVEEKRPQANTVSNNDENKLFVTALLVIVSNPDIWYIDSGASQLMTSHRECFITYLIFEKGVGSFWGDDSSDEINGQGVCSVQLSNGVCKDVHDARHVPGLTKNLLSISRIADIGIKVEFNSDSYLLKTKQG